MIGLKRKGMMIAASMLLAVSTVGCSSTPDNDAVVAKVGEDTISYGVANFYVRMQQAQYETYYAPMMGQDAETMWSQKFEEGITFEEETKESMLEALEDMYLIRQHAQAYEVSITEEEQEEIDKAADEFVENNVLEDKEAVSGEKEYVQELLELYTIQAKMDAPMKEGVDTEVSDEDAAQKKMEYVYFSYTKTDEEGNSSQMSDEEKEALKEEANSFLDTVKADANKDMNAAASSSEVEVSTATFDSETTTVNSALVQAADALEQEGDVTDLVETDGGIYVAKLVSKLDRDATDKEKEQIVEERRQEQYNTLLTQWREETDIQVEKSVWEKIDFKKQGVIIKQDTEETTQETE